MFCVNKDKIQQIQFLLDQVNCNNNDNAKRCWALALKDHNIKFVAKGDAEYKNVYNTFMKHLKD